MAKYPALAQPAGNLAFGFVATPCDYSYMVANVRIFLSLAILGSVGCQGLISGGNSDGGDDGGGNSDDGPITMPAGQISIEGGAKVTANSSITLNIGAPDGATEMKISGVADFSGAIWEPLASTKTATLDDVGYVMLFVRFRDPDKNLSETAVVGIEHKPFWEVSATSRNGGAHSVSLAYPVRNDIVALRIDAGRVVREPPTLVGNAAVLNEHVDGAPLDTVWAGNAGNYTIRSADDAAFANGVSPTAVHRKSMVAGYANEQSQFVQVHWLYLRLPTALSTNKSYSLEFAGGRVASYQFAFDENRTYSGAVHVNHLGFRPQDTAKVAYLSHWMGDGGALGYNGNPVWRLINVANGTSVREGTGVLTRNTGNPATSEGSQGNATLADTYQMDFSSYTEAGQYKLCVVGIGCSHPFRIDERLTWRKAAVQVARGLYHQRSGIALGAPHTAIARPRPYHPDDGMQIFHADISLAENDFGDDNFAQLNAARTTQLVPEAWGGHFDAGDWDRRIQHLAATRQLLELFELFPDYIGSLELNIPESRDAIPDLVDEGLWSLDAYRRMQMPDGGIRGGIEAEAFSHLGSWQEPRPVMAYKAGVWE